MPGRPMLIKDGHGEKITRGHSCVYQGRSTGFTGKQFSMSEHLLFCEADCVLIEPQWEHACYAWERDGNGGGPIRG